MQINDLLGAKVTSVETGDEPVAYTGLPEDTLFVNSITLLIDGKHYVIQPVFEEGLAILEA